MNKIKNNVISFVFNDSSDQLQIINRFTFSHQENLRERLEKYNIPVDFTGSVVVETTTTHGSYHPYTYHENLTIHFENGIVGNNNGPAIESKIKHSTNSRTYDYKIYYTFGKESTKKAWEAARKKGNTIIAPESNCCDIEVSSSAHRTSSINIIGDVRWKTDNNNILYWVYNSRTKEFWGIDQSLLTTAKKTGNFNSGIDKLEISIEKRLLAAELKLILAMELNKETQQILGMKEQ